MKTPELSMTANTDWSDGFEDIHSIIEKESRSVEPTVETRPTSTPQTVEQMFPDDNSYTKPYEQILDEEIEKKPKQDLYTAPKQQEVKETYNPHKDIFEIAKEIGVLHIPKGFDTSNMDAKKLQQLADITNRFRLESIHERYKQEIAHDPYMLEMLEYSRQGGKFADLPRMREILDSEIDYSSLNLDDEEVQKNLVYQFMSYDLRPEDEKDARLLAMIPSRIDELGRQLKLKNEAINAQRYFLNIIDKEREEEYVRLERDKQEEQKRLQQERYEADKWDKDFRKALQDSGWSADKKAAIETEAGFITLDNGTRMPLWQYKQQIIFNNPRLFQHFLDFTSKFDLRNGFNKQIYQNPEQDSVNEILSRINKKGQSFDRTQMEPLNPNNKNRPRVVNLDEEWF